MARAVYKRTKMRSADFMMLVLTLILIIFGVIMVFSSSYYWSIDQYGQPYHFLIRDIFWVGSGFVLMLGAMIVDYHVLAKQKVAVGLLILSIMLLGLVLTPLGQNINGATRWIGIGPLTIMPGEVAKICAIIFVSWYLSDKPERVLSWIRGVIPMLLLGGVYAGLIMLQPNMSTAITVVFIIMMIMFVAGMKYKHLFVLMGIGAAGMCALIFMDKDGYRLKRVTSFLDPFKLHTAKLIRLGFSLNALRTAIILRFLFYLLLFCFYRHYTVAAGIYADDMGRHQDSDERA